MKMNRQTAEPKYGKVGEVWYDKPNRGTRELKITGRVDDRMCAEETLSLLKTHLKSHPVATWRLEVIAGGPLATPKHKPVQSHRVVVYIRDDVLGRLFTQAPF